MTPHASRNIGHHTTPDHRQSPLARQDVAEDLAELTRRALRYVRVDEL
ncbi:hypothetical protein OG863_07600 [Streptomyces decoyicus]|uniref:TetR family transcriptional regulator n=1 Tax=Streptomyces decoyicus TaxID=249567 RepID=A0ABZ1FCN6_9ACTN|nr:hypothetical protein [Streptomyces decoyicus]WSB67833.1 hypothetical protein OG863_07600 [Streptomyces decoyicus]